MSERIDRVRVVNHNTFTIRDRHDGVPYVFVPGVAVDVPPDVAQHLFNYPGEEDEMHRHMARRWGWNRPEHAKLDDDGVALWEKLTKNIAITVEHYELRRVHEPGAPIPAEFADEAPEMIPEVRAQPVEPRRSGAGRRRPIKRSGKRRAPARPRAQSEQVPEIQLTMESPKEG